MENCIDINSKRKSERFNLFMIANCSGLGVIGYLVMSVLFSAVLGGFYNSLDRATYESLIDSSIFQNAVYVVYALFCVVLPFVVIYFIMRFFSKEKLLYNKPKKDIGLLPTMVIGLGVCTLGNYATAIFITFVEGLFHSTPTGAPSDITSASQISFVGFLVSIVSTAVVPALVEEFAIRGVVMQPLRKYGDKFAVVISSLIFSLIHGNFQQIPFAFITGLALGYVVIRANSIWAGVLLHFLNNSWAVCSEYMSYLLPQKVHLIIYCATSLLICVAAIICAIHLYKKDVRKGITEGVLEGKICALSVFQKTLCVFCSPTFLLGVGYLIYTAFQNFAAV